MMVSTHLAPQTESVGMILQATPEEVAPFLSRFHMIDVREESEFYGEMGRIAGSALIPLSRVVEVTRGWEKDKPLLLICRSGRRSQIAAEHLAVEGFSALVNLVGGILAWKAQEYPIERGKVA